jgi:hypothetical protein
MYYDAYNYSARRGPSPSCTTVQPTSFTRIALCWAAPVIVEDSTCVEAPLVVSLVSLEVSPLAVPAATLELALAFFFFLEKLKNGMSCLEDHLAGSGICRVGSAPRFAESCFPRLFQLLSFLCFCMDGIRPMAAFLMRGSVLSF